MKPQELLRAMADRLDFSEKTGLVHNSLLLHHPRGSTRQFPFKGGDTERLSDTESGTNYAVSFSRICSYLAKALKV